MKKGLSKFISTMLAAVMVATGVAVVPFTTPTTAVQAASSLNLQESSGWLESAYVEWTSSNNSYKGYDVYVKKTSDTSYPTTPIDDPLIRNYGSYWRADAVGLAAGDYNMKVVPVDADKKELNDSLEVTVSVKAHDRNGAAFSSKSKFGGAGAYNKDGTLKSNAQVIYVNAANAKTITASVAGGAYKGTGLQDILYGLQKAGTNPVPLDIRIIGTIKASDMDKLLSDAEGIQIKGSKEYSDLNLTVEGIGEDAAIQDMGILLNKTGNVELRNFAVINCIDDSISIDTQNQNLWVHNMDFFYGQKGSDKDQVKGDGTVDVKAKSTYVTVSYNHFWDNGKSSLCGMKSELKTSLITYHHNWFDHSDSRHPRIRTMSVHIYNNYFDGNSKYGVGVTMGSSAFVEANVFRNCKYPMMSSGQGTDAAGDGTFSGETGGMIKAYNNSITGATKYYTQNKTSEYGYDAYEVTARSEQVPETETTVSGGTKYNNFDTDASFGINVSDDAVDNVVDDNGAALVTKIKTYAGRVNGGDIKITFTDADDSSYDVRDDIRTTVDTYSALINASTAASMVGGNGNGGNGSAGSSSSETTTSGDGSTETTTEGSEVTTTAPVISSGDYVQNFTTNGKESKFYSITGNLSKSKGTVTYGSLTLTQCLKMETSTAIDFDPGVAGTLTIVANKNTAGSILLNEKSVALDSSCVATISLDGSQSYEITKGDGTNNIYYLAFVPEGTTVTTLKGDADNSGTVDAADVTMIMDVAVNKLSAVTNAGNADVTGEGTVDLDDAYMISKYVNGKISSL